MHHRGTESTRDRFRAAREADVESITSRQTLYDYFDDYTHARKGELNKQSLKKGAGLLKAYSLETSVNGQQTDLSHVVQPAGWSLNQIDDGLYRVAGLAPGVDGFLDVLTPRYLALYTTAPSEDSDRAVLRAVRESVELDHGWFSSPLLNTIWRELVPQETHMFATLRYENQPWFEAHVNYPSRDVWPEDHQEEYFERDIGDGANEDVDKRQTARLEVRQRVHLLRRILPQEDGPNGFGGLMGNLSWMRVPATNEQGRYDYFQHGKVTNRGQEFRGFRAHLYDLLGVIYARLTSRVEDIASYHVERHSVGDGHERMNVHGALITYAFHRPLEVDVFDRFIESTFEKGQGPFRLWGNPIRLPGHKVHVYGLDLHLWQQIYLDLTPHRFLLILPKGTCGNTVHRLLANIQRYLTPRVDVWVGDVPYGQLIQEAVRTA